MGQFSFRTTGCCQHVPVAIPGRYREKEMLSAVMTKAAREEPSALPFPVTNSGFSIGGWGGMGPKPSCSFAQWAGGRSPASAVPSRYPHVCRLHPQQENKYTLRRGWMWEGGTLQSRSSFSKEQLLFAVQPAQLKERLESSHKAAVKVFSYLAAGILLHI